MMSLMWALVFWVAFSTQSASFSSAIGQPPLTPQPTVEFTAERKTTRIAEPIELKIVVGAPAGWRVTLPATLPLPDALRSVAPASEVTHGQTAAADLHMFVRRYEIEGYAAGLQTIESFSIQLLPPAAERAIVELQTAPLQVQVQTALGFFDSSTRLRPPTAALTVPWTAGQWLVLLAVLTVLIGSSVIALRWLNARLKRSLPGQRGFGQSLSEIDRQRLHGRLSHAQSVLQFAGLLRQALQLASGEPLRFRTTAEWISHCQQHYDDGTASAAGHVLTKADAIKFSGVSASLDDVRAALAASRQVLSRLEQTPQVFLAREVAA